jgi:nucleotide-binding universal stress UspA family protein
MKIKPASKSGGVLVELAPEESQFPTQTPFNLKKILVPVDFSDCSKYALQYAASFAKQFGAELQLVHVVEPYPAVPEMYPIDVESLQDGKAQLDTLRESLGEDVRARVSLRTGQPYNEITQAAADGQADLIIISTHGRKGLTRMLLGSTTEKVVRQAPCPVLVVRQPNTD